MDFSGLVRYQDPATTKVVGLGVPATIHDARIDRGVEIAPNDSMELLIDGPGFLLAHAPSAVNDWTDKDEVAKIYYAEATALVQSLLPSAELAQLRSHTFRNEDIKDHHWIDGIQYGPCAEFVHNDYADFMTPDRQGVTKSFAEVMGMPTDKRVIGLNVWRSVSDAPLARFPLAVCDRTSIDPDDLLYELNPNAPEPFNAHYCHPNDLHRWNYYSNMTKDEALVFITYDSSPSDGGLFRPTLHTAVRIPDSDGLTPRESVEIRFFAHL
jgi:hypothetical protein